jgi:hypothetical protein
MSQKWIAILGLSFVCSVTGGAQDTVFAESGARVRIRPSPGASWLPGRLVRVRADSVELTRCVQCLPSTYSLAGLNAFEVRVAGRPRGSTILGVALMGALVGAAGGYAHADRASSHCGDGPCVGIIIEPVAGAVVGVLVGAAVGTRIRYDYWRPAIIR